jgi:hypothetical protein
VVSRVSHSYIHRAYCSLSMTLLQVYQRGLSRRPARPWPGILALYAVIRVVFK